MIARAVHLVPPDSCGQEVGHSFLAGRRRGRAAQVEIRRLRGIGIDLECPDHQINQNGTAGRNP
jgi:hypothetical protein